jgi:hypothetical protein
MKKKLFVMLFLYSSVFISRMYALEEAYTTFGISFKNRFALTGDSVHAPGDCKGMAGLNINVFGFFNGADIGVYVVYNSLVPVYVTDLVSFSSIASYGGGQQEGSLGVGFRRCFTNRLTLLGGLGFDFAMDVINREFRNTDRHSTTMLDFGMLGEAGLKFDITNVMCISIGFYASYTFVSYNESPSEWMWKSSVTVNPFIGIGFNRYNYTTWGKP